MMSVAGLTSAEQTSLPGDKAHMLTIANAPRFWTHQNGFINPD
jgi:hypothetical protein